MNKEELMIGDWVYNTQNQQNEQVQEVGSGLVMLAYNDLYEYEEIEPIPLTKEILEKNGFYLCKADFYHPKPSYIWCMDGKRNDTVIDITLYNPSINGVKVLVKVQSDPLCGDGVNKIHNCDIEYVHQLQHALKLCGIRKEIKL